MLFAITSYLKFLLRSTNEHGVHSPFVFDLVTKCLYDKTQFPEYDALRRHRKALLADVSSVSMTDLGAGSRVFASKERRVSDIARKAGISNRRAKMLFRLTRYLKANRTLELGTSVGLATCALSMGNPKGRVISVEGCPQTAAVGRKYLADAGAVNVSVEVSAFERFLENDNGKFDLVFFDGNHQREATLRYFEILLPTVHNDSVWIFDDIHWSAGMEAAWEQIKKHPSVRVTVDTYQWGFVFFRSEQAREDFSIRV